MLSSYLFLATKQNLYGTTRLFTYFILFPPCIIFQKKYNPVEGCQTTESTIWAIAGTQEAGAGEEGVRVDGQILKERKR